MRDLHFEAAALGLYGSVRTTAPAAARFTAGSRGALALLVEGLDDVRAAWMLDRVEECFAASTQAPLSALIHAVRSAFRDLAAVGQDTTLVGMTAALVRGRECLFVQVPPAQAYVLHGGILRAIPQPALWAPARAVGTPVERPALVAPAAKWEIELETYRVSLEAGDTLALVSSRACTRLSEHDVRAALKARGFSRVLSRLSHGRRRYEHFCALVVRATTAGMPSSRLARALQAGVPALAWPSLARGRLPGLSGLRLSMQVERLRRAMGELAAAVALVWRARRISPTLPPRQSNAAAVPVSDQRAGAGRSDAALQHVRRPGRAVPVLAPAPALGIELRPQRINRRAPYPGRLLAVLGAVGAAGLLALLVWRVLPSSSESSQFTPAPRQYNLAAAALERARLAEEPAAALRLLDEAEGLLPPPGRRLAPAEAERAAALRAEIQAERDRRTGTTRLGPPRMVVDLRAAVGDPARAGALAVSGNTLFVLEMQSHRILRVQDGQARAVLGPGDRVGTLTIAEPWLLVARPAGGAYVFDSERRLVFLPPDGPPRVVPLRAAATWRRPVAAATFAANLYILDPDQGQVLRYVPAGGGFDAAPQPYIAAGQAVDLAAATALAIDGDVWVLVGGQNVLRFRGGRLQPFELAAALPPLAQAAAIFTSPESRALYLAEPERGRILQYNKNGALERQYLPSPDAAVLMGIAALSVDEAARRLVVSAGPLVLEYELPG